MVQGQCYFITKQGYEGDVVYFDFHQLEDGFNVTPKNQLQYDGIIVSKLIIIKDSLIQKVLRRKIQKKFELYLNYIVDLLEDDSDSAPSGLNEILGELSRYKDVLRYRYQKYLGDKYVELMNKKIDVLEYELKLKAMDYAPKQNIYDDEEVIERSR